ncbi:MAG: transposase [Leptospiraceae bacterium]|nr:transposase [Leptospiraceae bacterium]
MIKLFFLAVRQTLLSFSQKHLPGEPGAIMTLHTWSRTLNLHPHIHCLFTAGSEDKKGNWHDSGDFLFPIRAVSRYFRVKMLYLVREYAEELGTKTEVQEIIDPLFSKNWNVFITQKYPHGNGVIKYLSNYVRGGPIKNSRIVAYDGITVTFRYRDHRDNQTKLMTLPVEEFLRRFAMHIVPKRQRVIRALGLYAMKGKGIVELNELLNNSIPNALFFSQQEICPVCSTLLKLHKNLTKKQLQKYKPPPLPFAA